MPRSAEGKHIYAKHLCCGEYLIQLGTMPESSTVRIVLMEGRMDIPIVPRPSLFNAIILCSLNFCPADFTFMVLQFLFFGC